MKKNIQDLKVAIVYDHLLTRFGGAEFVLETLLDSFKDVTLFTTVHDTKNGFQTKVPVRTSVLQKFLPVTKVREILDIFTPIVIEQFDFSEFDLVLSVTSSAAKGIITTPKQLHICYLLTPTRYLYHEATELQNQHPVLSLPILKTLTLWILGYLRWWDQAAASKPDAIVAISKVVAERSQKYYHRTVDEIIYPPVPAPVSTENTFLPRNYSFVLSISRLMPYKRLDLAIAACKNANKNLVIIGEGREKSHLLKQAGEHAYVREPSQTLSEVFQVVAQRQVSIIFLGKASEAEKTELLAHCQAVLMPGIEDFGIAAVEANAYGKPAILSNQSGASEILEDKICAIQVREQTVEAYSESLREIDTRSFKNNQLQANAAQFTQEQFVRKFHNICFALYEEHSTIVG